MLCNINFQTGQWTQCYTPSARMASCDPTKFFPCADERDYCDSGTSKCTQRLSTGGACSSSGAQCIFADTCSGTSCVQNGAVGATCSSMGGAGCLGDLSCNNGTSCQFASAMTCM